MKKNKLKKVNVVPQTTNLEKGENEMKKNSRVKSFIVATGATLKDHKEGLKNIALVAMFIIILVLISRKPENTIEYREVPVVKEVVVEVPATTEDTKEEKTQENARNKNNFKRHQPRCS